MSRQKEYYEKNKSKVLAYKKEHYKKKHENYQYIKMFKIIGLKQYTSNKLIKTAFEAKCLYFYRNDKWADIEDLKDFQLQNCVKCLGVLDKDLTSSQCEFLTDAEALEFVDDLKERRYVLQLFCYD